MGDCPVWANGGRGFAALRGQLPSGRVQGYVATRVPRGQRVGSIMMAGSGLVFCIKLPQGSLQSNLLALRLPDPTDEFSAACQVEFSH
jgi:hypothetical protein